MDLAGEGTMIVNHEIDEAWMAKIDGYKADGRLTASPDRTAASVSQMGRLETDILIQPQNPDKSAWSMGR